MNTASRLENIPKNGSSLTFKRGENVIAVASGKSGVGKTWFAVTLAHAFSFFKKKTLFFDYDLGLTNIGTQLGLSIENDVDGIISGKITLNQAIHHCDKTKLDIVTGRSGYVGLSSIPTGRLQIIGDDLCLLAPIYDKVVIDVGDSVGKNGRVLPSFAQNIIALCTSEPESLTEVYAYIKIMTMEYPKNSISIVINKAETISEGRRSYATLLNACQNYLNISPKLLGIVRRDTRVRDAIRNQSPIINRYPTSEATEDVIAIVKKILG